MLYSNKNVRVLVHQFCGVQPVKVWTDTFVSPRSQCVCTSKVNMAPFLVLPFDEVKNTMNPNQFMHQNQILDGLQVDHPHQRSKYFDLVDGRGRPSETIEMI